MFIKSIYIYVYIYRVSGLYGVANQTTNIKSSVKIARRSFKRM